VKRLGRLHAATSDGVLATLAELFEE